MTFQADSPQRATGEGSSRTEILIRRKQDHLDLCRTLDVSSQTQAGWDAIRLPHVALPEIDFRNVSLRSRFLGFEFSSPFLISGMTGGSSEGERINELLAQFAQERSIPMGVGSQRVALSERNKSFFRLREMAPRAVLFANIGAVQLNYGVTSDDLKWIVEQLEAQALVLHANPLQEAIQAEGDRDFSGLWKKITQLKRELKIPIILKETGCGLDPQSCRRAVEAGLDALDIAGLGGTHWGFIEGLRNPQRAKLGEIFRNWGRPSAQALADAYEAVGTGMPLIASGGLRSGLDAAKALYLGAQIVGMALPFLKAVSEGGLEALSAFLDLHEEALRVALFCMGAETLESLSTRRQQSK
jgi:isopentenyl-diphosphate delta-isomerase